MTCPKHREIIDGVAGLASAERAAELERHAASCAACAEVRADAIQMIGRIKAPGGELESEQLVQNVMTLVRLNQAREDRLEDRRWRFGGRVAVFAALAAGVLLAVGTVFFWGPWRRSESVESGFSTRGGATTAERWISVRALRASGGVYRQVDGRIRTTDALAFAYENRGERPFSYLMIFAVDGHGAVYWYYPAYEVAGSDPTSVPIRSTRAEERLPDEVRHDLRPGTLRVYGVFSREKLSVETVEAAVARGLSDAGRVDALGHLDLDGTAQQTFTLHVETGP